MNKWFRNLVVSAVEGYFKKMGMSPEDFEELHKLLAERRRIKQDALDSAARFQERLKELAQG